jgi:uncharacterized protein (DUF58 family)
VSSSGYGALLDAVRGVHWPARRSVASAAAGTHHSKTRGTSAEFSEYRLYRQGDDPRRLDWRLLARSDRAYLRLATDRSILPTTIVLDTSASMAYPAQSRAKWVAAQRICVALAAIVHGDGDPVGVAVHDGRGTLRVLPPRSRRTVVDEIARVVDASDPDGLDPLAPAIAALRSLRIVVISDLLGDSDQMLRAARARIAAAAEVHVVHIVAREEIEPPRRTLLAADPEAPGTQRLLSDTTRVEYQRAFGEWRREMARLWRGSGAVFTEVIADEPVPHAVRRITGQSAAGGAR